MSRPGKNGVCEIWAVSSGKGGTGKSFVASSIGASLASMGKRVVLIDADFGGANLHSFLGIDRPKKTLTDFFEKRVPLNDLIISTGVGDLGLITGDLHSLDSGNVKYAQKLKFFRHIKAIDTDYILIDLGTGAHYKTIDTFLLADKMLIIVVPELIAIENMYQFVKNVVFRKLTMSFGAHGLKDTVQNAWKKRDDYGVKNLKDLMDYLRDNSPQNRDIIQNELSTFCFYVVSNQIRSTRDIALGSYVKSILVKYFGFNARYVGYIGYDDCVWKSVNKRQPFMQTYPLSRCAKEIEKLTENLMEGRQVVIRRG